MRSLLSFLVAALALPLAAATPEPLVEPGSGTRFQAHPVVGGVEFECLGTGERRVRLSSKYAVTFCLEAAKTPAIVGGYVGRAHAGSVGDALASALRDDGLFFRDLVFEPAGRLVVLRALTWISRDALGKELRRALEPTLPQDTLDRLAAAIGSDVPEGAVVRISSRGTELTIDVAGQAIAVDDAALVREVWRVWLGPKSLTPDLREDVANRIGDGAVKW